MRLIRIFTMIACLSTALSGRAVAQATPTQAPAKYERGCRGDAVTFAFSPIFGVATSYPVVTMVDSQSPADIAGIQVGDTVVAQGGVDFLNGQPPAQRFAVGDTIHLVVHRAGTPHDIAIVLGRRTLTAPGTPPVCRPEGATATAAH